MALFSVNPPQIDRLQGTDGIRSRVRPASEFPESPLEVFLRHGVITEEFFELYCYAHVSNLIESGKMREGDEILIGWDSRDVEGFYTYGAISGISKAGGAPALLGILPTPGVAMALVRRSAAGAFMITASHNPKDQNGIKIFLAPHALKMLPEDDMFLTKKIMNTDYETLRKTGQRYKTVSVDDEGRKSFVNFHVDPRNSLLPEGTEGLSLFADTVLVVDPAHGAMSAIGAEVFRHLGFGEVIEVAGAIDGSVNENSGVAFLEGIREIDKKMLEEEPGIGRHELVKKMFIVGRNREYGNGNLLGVVFDADGDRFFITVYDRKNDAIKILSGDETAAFQSEFLVKNFSDDYIGTTFVHTVESDINAARHAVSLGFRPEVTAVGDKWILQKAVEDGNSFGIGNEETGHSIHRGFLTTDAGDEKTVYAGNGLKGAINTLVALLSLGKGKAPEEFAAWASVPFEPGFKKSVYAYYINKQLFSRGSEVWIELEKILNEETASYSESLSLTESEVENEPDMLYLRIEKGGETVGTIFARNSGTEDKISVNGRGAAGLEGFLSDTLNRAVVFLMGKMKDEAKPMAVAEAKILKELYNGGTFDAGTPDAGLYGDVNFERLVFEMEIKQKLISRKAEGLEITSLGRELVG